IKIIGAPKSFTVIQGEGIRSAFKINHSIQNHQVVGRGHRDPEPVIFIVKIHVFPKESRTAVFGSISIFKVQCLSVSSVQCPNHKSRSRFYIFGGNALFSYIDRRGESGSASTGERIEYGIMVSIVIGSLLGK